MSRRLAAGIGVLALAIAAVAGLLLLRADSGGDRALAVVSNRGRPVDLAVPEHLAPGGWPTGEAFLIAERERTHASSAFPRRMAHRAGRPPSDERASGR